MSLNDICYEQIEGDYWYGLYEDYKLVIDKRTGYFNATKLCSSSGKRFDNWIRLDGSKFLIEKAEQRLKINVFYVKEGGNRNQTRKQITGTFMHKCLLEEVIRWSLLPKKSNKQGFIYIATTSMYKEHNIRKVGFTKSLENRLKQLNSYRTNFDLFFFEDTFKVDDAQAFERMVHQELKEVRYEKEFFKCNLSTVVDTIKQLIEEQLVKKLSKLDIM